jgi:hypothetical protein
MQHLVSEAIDERLRRLKEMSVSELTKLPEQSSEQLMIGGAQLTISVWHDRIGEADHRIVVQAYRPGILVGRMDADGFVITSSGAVRPLSKEEWAPFS